MTGDRLWDLSYGQATSGLVIQRFSGDASAEDGTRKDGRKEEGFHSSSLGRHSHMTSAMRGGRGQRRWTFGTSLSFPPTKMRNLLLHWLGLDMQTGSTKLE